MDTKRMTKKEALKALYDATDGEETAKIAFDSSKPNYGWTAVPEPTSGLLLLLGVAGLALKRKRA